MALFQAKALGADGKEIDVQLDDDHFVPAETHKLKLESTVKERLAKQGKSLRDELAKDDGYFAELAQARGVDLSKKGKETDAETIERIRAEIRKAEVDPLSEKAKQHESRAQRLIESRKRAELKAAFASVADEALVDLLVERYAKELDYHEESDAFAVKDGDSFAFSAKATKEKPYKGVDELAQAWASDKKNASFVLKARKQDGPGIGRTGSNPGALAAELAALPPEERINRARALGMK